MLRIRAHAHPPVAQERQEERPPAVRGKVQSAPQLEYVFLGHRAEGLGVDARRRHNAELPTKGLPFSFKLGEEIGGLVHSPSSEAKRAKFPSSASIFSRRTRRLDSWRMPSEKVSKAQCTAYART